MNNIKILLVDDRNENLIAMQKTLAPLELDIITTTSGNDALKLMLQYDFAVVLLDVMMPNMNGFEVAELMHQNDITKHIPIIFITAINTTEQHYIQGMEAGAIDYLYKPIDPIILLNKVRVFVDLFNVRKKLQDTNIELKRLSEEDMLTKAANRRHFEDEIIRLMDLYKENGQYMSLLFIDVDDFKTINDSYGHRAGDLVLIELINRIKNIQQGFKSNNSDIKIDLIARLGGDEFAVVTSNLNNNPKKVEDVAKLILKKIEPELECDGSKIHASISIGIASYPQSGDSLRELLKAADIALYKAKSKGKNTYSIHQ